MVYFTFTKYSGKCFYKLPKSIQKRILDKLKSLKEHEDIFLVLKKLINFEPATHRLRVGNYRLILELKLQGEKKMEFLVLDVGHRKDIYK